MSEVFELHSTDGDYDLDQQLRSVPGLFQHLSLETVGTIHISGFITIEGDVHVALLVDGVPLCQWYAEVCFDAPHDIQLTAVTQLLPGHHVIELAAKSVGAAGPRDWSPRWEKEGKPFGKIIRSSKNPLRMTVVKV